MYFDGNTLTTLLSDAEKAAANAPAIAADGRAQTSPLAVIEAAVELPELGEAGVTAFLDAQGIELRDMPPGHRLIAGALANLEQVFGTEAVGHVLHAIDADVQYFLDHILQMDYSFLVEENAHG